MQTVFTSLLPSHLLGLVLDLREGDGADCMIIFDMQFLPLQALLAVWYLVDVKLTTILKGNVSLVEYCS
jgi:hypothetical protein